MEITITPELEQYVAGKVASGSFASSSEVFEAGLEMLRDEDRTVEQWLVHEVVPALEELKADPNRVRPIDEAFAEICREYAAKAETKVEEFSRS